MVFSFLGNARKAKKGPKYSNKASSIYRLKRLTKDATKIGDPGLDLVAWTIYAWGQNIN